MSFRLLLVSVVAAWLGIASAAQASLTLTATTHSTSSTVIERPNGDIVFPQFGDVITIDITLRSDGQGVIGLRLDAFGYDSSIVTLVSATAASNFLNTLCLDPVGCLGGFQNLASPTPIEETDANGTFVNFATGVNISFITNDGTIDPGAVNGIAGEAQFQLVFAVQSAGFTTIDIGLRSPNSVAFEGIGGEVIGTSVILAMPEPGTATLLGLGLLGLASRSRNERHG